MNLTSDQTPDEQRRGETERAQVAMREYVVIFECGARNWGAYVPDLPGCIAAGDTLEETEELVRGAIEMHLEGMREDGDPIPQPRSRAAMVSVAAQ